MYTRFACMCSVNVSCISVISFSDMPSENTKLYLQFIHLLIEGGSCVLRQCFLKKLRSCGIDFSNFNCDKVVKSKEQYNILQEDK